MGLGFGNGLGASGQLSCNSDLLQGNEIHLLNVTSRQTKPFTNKKRKTINPFIITKKERYQKNQFQIYLVFSLLLVKIGNFMLAIFVTK